ncbi:MAG: alpha/beta fold hydrolase [Actinobacteria bacterium]|nr:alpha/beta fold hydrolase [Actinomycetota bacterium]
MESRQASVGGVPVRWEERGEGPPVVLVHGIPTSPALWRHVVPLLDGARCLAFEMVGYGESIPAGRGRDISVAQQSDYLLGWLDELAIERAILVGHDLGGGVAHIAAIHQPQRCAGLLLTNAVGYDSWPIPSVKGLRAVSDVFARLHPRAVQPVLATLMVRGHDDLQLARDAFAVHWRPYSEHDGAAALARQVTSLDVRDTLAVQDQIRDLDVPARVVWGAADQFQKVRYGERFAWDLGVELHRIEGAKHFVPEDHPHVIAGAIDELLAEW